MRAFIAGPLVCALSLCAQVKPPVTRQDNVPQTFHGVTIVDPYHWLEDGASSTTRAWIGQQNAYAHALLDTQPVRTAISARLAQMLRHDHLGGPELRGGYYFFVKHGADEDLWSIYRRKASGGPDELLIDPAPLSADHRTSVSSEGASEDGNLLAYSVRQGGEDETEIHIFDVRKHADIGKPLPKALYLGLSWKMDGSGFYYALGKRDAGKRVYFHALAADAANDSEIFGGGFGPDTWIEPVTSENGHYLLLVVQHGWAQGELYFQPLAGNARPQPLIMGIDARFDPQFAGAR